MSNKINLPDQLTVEKANQLKAELDEIIKKGEKEIIIDFNNCDYIDSTGLGVLVSAHRKLLEKGGSLMLCSMVNPQIIEIFKLTRLDKVFSIK